MNSLWVSNKAMSLYRYELQYHDMQPTQIAPGKIRQYPQNLAMQSVVGRNLANTAWDVLAAKQQQGHEAMQRDEQIRMLSMQTGVPEVHLHSSVPHGHQNVIFQQAMGVTPAPALGLPAPAQNPPAPPPPPGAPPEAPDVDAPEFDSVSSAMNSVTSAMKSVRSRNTGHTSVTQAQVQAHQDQREMQDLESRARHAAVQRLVPEDSPTIAREVHLPGPVDHVPHPSAIPRPGFQSGTSGAMARKRMKTTVIRLPRASRVPNPFGLSPADELAGMDEEAFLDVEEPAPAAEIAMEAPHIDDVPEVGYMPRPDGTPDPTGRPEVFTPARPEVIPEAARLASIPEAYQGRFGPRQASFLQGLDVAGETAKRVGLVGPGAMAGAAAGMMLGPAGAVAGGIAGGVAGMAYPAMSPQAQQQTLNMAVGTAQMAGQYSLELTKLKMQFVGFLATMITQATLKRRTAGSEHKLPCFMA